MNQHFQAWKQALSVNYTIVKALLYKYTNMGWQGDGSHRRQVRQTWTVVRLPTQYPRWAFNQNHKPERQHVKRSTSYHNTVWTKTQLLTIWMLWCLRVRSSSSACFWIFRCFSFISAFYTTHKAGWTNHAVSQRKHNSCATEMNWNEKVQ